LQIYWWWRK